MPLRCLSFMLQNDLNVLVFKKNLEDILEATFTPFWTSGDTRLGFQSQGGCPHSCSLSPVHNRILRFTSGVTPADLLAASMAAEQFLSTYLQTSIGGARTFFLGKCFFFLTKWSEVQTSRVWIQDLFRIWRRSLVAGTNPIYIFFFWKIYEIKKTGSVCRGEGWIVPRVPLGSATAFC